MACPHAQVQADGALASVPVNLSDSVQWLGGATEMPGDGRDLDATTSRLESPLSGDITALLVGVRYNLTLQLINSFHSPVSGVNISEIELKVVDQAGELPPRLIVVCSRCAIVPRSLFRFSRHSGARAADLTIPRDSLDGTLSVGCVFLTEGLLIVTARHHTPHGIIAEITGSPMKVWVQRDTQRVTVVRLGVLNRILMFLNYV